MWLGTGPDTAWASDLVGDPVGPVETGLGVASTFSLASRGSEPVGTSVAVPVSVRISAGLVETAERELRTLASQGRLPTKPAVLEVRTPKQLEAVMCAWPTNIRLKHGNVLLALPQCANGRNCVGYAVQTQPGSGIVPSSLIAYLSWDEIQLMASTGALPLGVSLRSCVLCIWREVHLMLAGEPGVTTPCAGSGASAGAGSGAPHTRCGFGADSGDRSPGSELWVQKSVAPYTVPVGPGGYDATKCFLPVHRPGSGILGGVLRGPFPSLNFSALAWVHRPAVLPGASGVVAQIDQGGMLDTNPGLVPGASWDQGFMVNHTAPWSEMQLAPGACDPPLPVIREMDLVGAAEGGITTGAGAGAGGSSGGGSSTEGLSVPVVKGPGGAFRDSADTAVPGPNDSLRAFTAATMVAVVPPPLVPDGGTGTTPSGIVHPLGLPSDASALDF